jgi:hypothetical protein
MPVFEVTGPDGTKYRITGPEGSTHEEAIARVQAQVGGAAPAQPQASTPEDTILPSQTVPRPQGAGPNAPVSQYPGQPEVQGVGRGIVNAAMTLPEIVLGPATQAVPAAINAGMKMFGSTGFEVPSVPSPSQAITGIASKTAESAGVPVADFSKGSTGEQLRTNVADFATQAGVSLPMMLRHAATRAAALRAGGLPEQFDGLFRPYMGASQVRPVVGDAVAAAGAGAAKTGVDQTDYKDNPIAQTLATIGGGVGGVSTLGAAEGAARQAARVPYVGKPIRAAFDAAGSPAAGGYSNITDADNPTASPFKNATVDRAAAITQNKDIGALDPGAALSRMNSKIAELSPEVGVLPPPAAMSEDVGLVNLVDAINSQGNRQGTVSGERQAFNSSIRDTIERIAPESANPADLENRIRDVANQRTGAARQEVDQAQTYVDRTQQVRQGDANALGAYQGQGTQASANIDQMYRGTRTAELEQNRNLYAQPEITEADIPVAALRTAVDNIRGQATELSPVHPVVEPFLHRIDNMEGDTVPGRGVTGFVSDVEGAIAGNKDNGLVVRQLRALKQAARGLFDQAPEGPALDAVNEARTNYQTRVAPNFRQGAGGELNQKLTGDQTRVRPSETADRFLNRPEDAQQLQQIGELAGQGPQTAQNSRTWLMDELSRTGVASGGTINPDRLARWANINGARIDAVPGMRQQIDGMLDRAQRGERVAGRFDAELETAQGKAKQTQDEIDKGALGSIMRADPKDLVTGIMEAKQPFQRMNEVLQAIGPNNQAAKDGLKAAVRDWLVDSATNTTPGQMLPGDTRGPVSFAKSAMLFNKHRETLAKVFDGPGEMNAMNAGHEALRLADGAKRQPGVGGGSPTLEKMNKTAWFERVRDTPLARGVETYMRFSIGALETGGKIAGLRRALGTVGSAADQEVGRVLQMAASDPRIMAELLGRKLAVGSPAWNARLNQLMAAGAGAREFNDEDEPPSSLRRSPMPAAQR